MGSIRPNPHNSTLNTSREEFRTEENGLQCLHCPMILPGPRQLNAHIAKHHRELMVFNCNLCGKGYMTASGLHHHLRAHNGKQFLCPVCGGKFTQKYHMKKHLRLAHSSAQCFRCHDVFPLGPTLDLHIQQCCR